ncbi:isochorismate synthase [Bhargavaea beijingensis]|uniref:isochorismate synthase n=1 Tax=Bhargavaea beijingensis TaxID=426756 RepID=A0A1G7H9I7_9BACL|nr:isochorismate synthase [Bhargavaea beijingensis]MCW1928598.1 isochorismate synthase [Bhargavaea beijingensis]RSK35939.1 isochorismate synthase [Bhargavaea beijingensis]SDE96779.1 isochorismate synthase [Bhargavaea beijingensis]
MKRKTTPDLIAGSSRMMDGLRFYTETVESDRLSTQAFFEAGEAEFAGHRFYWENREKTRKIAGIGHAARLTSTDGDARFEDIRTQWQRLSSVIVKEEGDQSPVLFGGFSFDPENRRKSEWERFPAALFVVPQIQLVEKDGRTFVSINLISEDTAAAADFDRLRVIRDRLIHEAQVKERGTAVKPDVLRIREYAKADYLRAVEGVRDGIREGGPEKVVIARSVGLEFKTRVRHSEVLEHLAAEQQESYLFGLENGGDFFFGATPERLVKMEDGRSLTACVAGSIRRGKTAEEDRMLGEGLLKDPKNREEHQFVVEMIGDVFRSFCSDIHIPAGPRLLKVRDIQHLFTPVEGKPNAGTDLLDLVQALHPTPALGGTPRNEALRMIRENEKMDRGFYGAPIGWMDTDGDGEFAVAIRSGLLKGDRAHLYAGGGIVGGSVPEEEYEETWVKFRPMMRALGGVLHG